MSVENLKEKKQKKLFWKGFCLSFNAYKYILQEIQEQDVFEMWTRYDAVSCPPDQLELLILGLIRYVGVLHSTTWKSAQP